MAASRVGERTIVLVGATSGIGRHAAVRLGAAGHRLLLVGRDERRGARLVAEIGPARAVFIAGDVSTRAGIEAVVGEIRSRTGAVDTLMNNAGVMVPRRVTSEGHELHFAVHHLAPFSMTGLLLPLLARGDGRIVNTNSEGHRAALFGAGPIDLDFDDLDSERGFNTFRTYSRTKLANLLFTYEFHRRYPEFMMVALHPGMVRTKLLRGVRNPGYVLLNAVARWLLMSPAKGAEPLVHLATAPGAELRNGTYYDRFTPVSSSAQSMSRAGATRLWEITERLRGPFAPSEDVSAAGQGA